MDIQQLADKKFRYRSDVCIYIAKSGIIPIGDNLQSPLYYIMVCLHIPESYLDKTNYNSIPCNEADVQIVKLHFRHYLGN